MAEGLQGERQGLLVALAELAARQVAGQDRDLLAAGAAGLPPQAGLRRGVVNNQQLVGDAVVNSLQLDGDAALNNQPRVEDAALNSLRPAEDVALNSLQPAGDAVANSLRPAGDAVVNSLRPVGDVALNDRLGVEDVGRKRNSRHHPEGPDHPRGIGPQAQPTTRMRVGDADRFRASHLAP